MSRNYAIYELQKGDEIMTLSSFDAADFLKIKRETFLTYVCRKKLCKGFKIMKLGDTFHRESHKTRLNKIWSSMHERCERKNHDHYKDYGGRGIKVCPEWDNYLSFKRWAINNGYSDALTLDRINVNGDYEPDNCRWVTMKEQQRNKRTNRFVEYKGEKYVLIELAEKIGINKTTLKERLNAGWSVEDAVEKPIRRRTRGYRMSKQEGAER